MINAYKKSITLGLLSSSFMVAIPPVAQQNGAGTMPSAAALPEKAPSSMAPVPSNGAPKKDLKSMTPAPEPIPQAPLPKEPQKLQQEATPEKSEPSEGMKPGPQKETMKPTVQNEKMKQLVHELTQDVTKVLEEKLLKRIQQVVDEEVNKLK